MKNPLKSTMKKVHFVLFPVLVLFQFYRPTKSVSAEIPINTIAQHYTMPDNVDRLLRVSGYDCPSNNTVCPWYSNVQPVDLWLDDHIHDGKETLEFR